MFRFLIPALALALVPIAAFSGVTITDDMRQPEFDVAGVTLGMQPAIAFSELEKRGYVLDENSFTTKRGPSFDELVKIQSGALPREGAVASWAEATFKKGTEEGVHIKFKPLPTGDGAHTIVYLNMAGGMDFERFLAAATNKYGKPAFADSSKARWSDMPLIAGEFNADAGAVFLEARDGLSQFGGGDFQQIKASLTLKGGRIGMIDPEEEAKIWVPPVQTTF